jgi:hypothetical protein
VDSSTDDLVSPNGTCVDSTNCLAMQSCELGLCGFASKTCPSDCSGKGRCQLELKTSGEEVAECLINDFTCQAKCVCEEGFSGSGCSETRSAMQAKQQTRYQFILYFNSTMQSEDSTIDSLIAQIVLIMDLGSNPSELTEASCLILQHIIDNIFVAAVEVEVPISIVQGLLGVLDNCDQVYIDGGMGNNARLSSELSSGDAAASALNNKILRTTFNELALKFMIVGENDQQFVDSHSRSTILKQSISDDSEQSIPQTQLEKLFSQPKSFLRIQGSKGLTEEVTRSIVLEENDLSLYVNNSEFFSNPLKVQCSLSSETPVPGADNQYVVIVFQNNAPQEYITNNNSSSARSANSTTTFVTTCENYTSTASPATPTSVNYTCPSGQVVSHMCTDKSEVITTQCPALRYLPICRILSSNDKNSSQSQTCDVMSFTSTNVTCNCTILLQQSSSGTDNGRRHLYGSSAVESSGYIEMVSMSEYTYEGFVSTNSEITEVSISDLQHGMIVIVMFSVFWGCGLLGLYELVKSAYCSCCPKVQPKPPERKQQRPSSTKTLSSNAKKDYLLKYIDEILPIVFCSGVEDDSTFQSVWKTICTYHPYAIIFTAEGPGAKEMKIQKGIYMLTLQAMLMFIMAVLCDLQV